MDECEDPRIQERKTAKGEGEDSPSVRKWRDGRIDRPKGGPTGEPRVKATSLVVEDMCGH